MAAIAANVIVATNMFPGEKIKTVTFGEPRTGDREFADAHDKMVCLKILHSFTVLIFMDSPTSGTNSQCLFIFLRKCCKKIFYFSIFSCRTLIALPTGWIWCLICPLQTLKDTTITDMKYVFKLFLSTICQLYRSFCKLFGNMGSEK